MSERRGVSTRDALLQRLRFERSLGIEAVPRTPLAPQRGPAPEPATAHAPPPDEPDAETTPADPAAQSRQERFEALRQRALACTNCALHRGRTNVVFGEGPCPARLVFVGEGPGFDEDQSGRPFVGKAGQLLNKIIAAMGFKREEIYIGNVVKCRPPENRTPLATETAACWPYLEEQLALLEPKVIVTLGSPAAKTLLKTSSGITQLRGRWQLYRGIRVMPTYHPAFVLRQYTQEVRRLVWNDMQQVMKFLKEASD
jgi:DNA polymerase